MANSESFTKSKRYLQIVDAPASVTHKRLYHCSFCGRDAYSLDIPVVGNPAGVVYICADCVATCNVILVTKAATANNQAEQV